MIEIRSFDDIPRLKAMRELSVDGVTVKVYETDVSVFLQWIQEGQHPVYFVCSPCHYKGTAKLSSSDVDYAKTGQTVVTCPSCERQITIHIPENGHELTKQALVVA